MNNRGETYRVVSWNLRRAKSTHPAWEILRELDADIILLQESGEIPDDLRQAYNVYQTRPKRKNGKDQAFSTATLAKGSITSVPANSKRSWTEVYFENLKGNLQFLNVTLFSGATLNLVNVYSPAWPIIPQADIAEDVAGFKLDSNKDIYATEFLTEHLRNSISGLGTWLIGGDFNSSETFDTWQQKPRGNKEFMDRLELLHLRECLRGFNGLLVPTYFNARSKRAEHQIDHIYVSKNIYSNLRQCSVHFQERVLVNNLSDHFPIVADFAR